MLTNDNQSLYQFTPREFERLWAARAAVREGFYNEGSEPFTLGGAHNPAAWPVPERLVLEALPSGEFAWLRSE